MFRLTAVRRILILGCNMSGVMKILSAVLLASAISHAHAQTPDGNRIRELEQKLEALEQKYRALEQKFEASEAAASEKPKPAPSVSIGASGFTMQSADTKFAVKIRGLLQVDSRWYFDDPNVRANDSFVLRRARPIIEGTVFRDFEFTFVPEFGGTGNPSIVDAYVNYKYSPALQLRIGKYKEPVGLEQLQSDANAPFIERGIPTLLTPNRDLGLMLHGSLGGGLFEYQAGVFNGIGDNRNSNNADTDDEKDVAARVFFHPFNQSENEYLKGLGVGLAGTYGNHEGDGGLPAGNGYVTSGQQSFFQYAPSAIGGVTPTVTADGEAWRLTPQAYWYSGPFSLMGEYVVSSQTLRLNAPAPGAPVISEFQHSAWQIVGGYVITGEDASYRGVKPARNFDLSGGGWGAFEVVARYAELDIDDDVFAGGGPGQFANPARWATEIASFGLGLNWYLNKQVRSAINFYHTDFKGGNVAGALPSKDENTIFTRVQLAF